MHPFVDEILRKGIGVKLEYNAIKERNEYIIDGFYKSGTIKLIERVGYGDNAFLAESRYDQIDFINTFNDLVYLNYEWWMDSRERYEGWADPDPQWLPHLIGANLIKVETKAVYKPNNK